MWPDFAPRAAVAVAIGIVGAVLCAAFAIQNAVVNPTDYEFWWRGTRAWLAGVDPYALRPHTPAWPLVDRLFYPLPALLYTIPLARVPVVPASALFFGASSGWLAWLLTKRGEWWRLLAFVSPMWLCAAKFGQWSVLLTAAALVPWAGGLFAAKPTLGLACFLYRPTWRAVGSGTAVLVASLLLMPTWPMEWRENLRTVVQHPAPVAVPFGWLLLIAGFRWRTPEGRLLLGMACVPQLLLFYDQVPLILVARTRLEAMCLALAGFLAAGAWDLLELAPKHDYVHNAPPYVLAGCYLPALVIVLLHRRAAASGRAAVAESAPDAKMEA